MVDVLINSLESVSFIKQCIHICVQSASTVHISVDIRSSTFTLTTIDNLHMTQQGMSVVLPSVNGDVYISDHGWVCDAVELSDAVKRISGITSTIHARIYQVASSVLNVHCNSSFQLDFLPTVDSGSSAIICSVLLYRPASKYIYTVIPYVDTSILCRVTLPFEVYYKIMSENLCYGNTLVLRLNPNLLTMYVKCEFGLREVTIPVKCEEHTTIPMDVRYVFSLGEFKHLCTLDSYVQCVDICIYGNGILHITTHSPLSQYSYTLLMSDIREDLA